MKKYGAEWKKAHASGWAQYHPRKKIWKIHYVENSTEYSTGDFFTKKELEEKMKKRSYCTQNQGNCQTCSLVNFRHDCYNNPIPRPDHVAIREEFPGFFALSCTECGRGIPCPDHPQNEGE